MTIFQDIKEGLKKLNFVVVIGKYDHVLGPTALYTAVEIKDQNFIRDLLRDALNTRNKFVIIDYGDFFSQVCKVDVKDPGARGGKQLYAIILLRDPDYPLIPSLYLQRMEALFYKIGEENILTDNPHFFDEFSKEVNNIYKRKEEVLPIEEFQLKVRSGVNNIQGFCELLLEMLNTGDIPKDQLQGYIEIMLDSCNEITKAFEAQFKK